jgi:hypothetical protein
LRDVVAPKRDGAAAVNFGASSRARAPRFSPLPFGSFQGVTMVSEPHEFARRLRKTATGAE